MISILNGYDFKRNFKNEVVYPISQLSSILNIQPYQLKEHYFLCVLDDCLAQGEYHKEEIINNEIEIYLPSFNLKALIDSLIREGFKIDEFQAKTVVEKILETQNIVSESFDMQSGTPNYSDPIRKAGDLPFIKPIHESITQNKDE